MSLTIYKPNKNNAGSLFNINFVARPEKENAKGDKSFYVKLVRQVSWDENKQTGSFSGGASVIAKLSLNEMAGILDAINRNVSLASSMGTKYVYHDGDESASIIDFSPAFKKVKKGEEWVATDEQKGFSLRITKTDKKNKDKKDSFAVGFTYSETELLALFIKDGLGHCFNALRSEEIERLRKYSETKNAEKQPARKQQEKKEDVKAAEPEPQDTNAETEEDWG